MPKILVNNAYGGYTVSYDLARLAGQLGYKRAQTAAETWDRYSEYSLSDDEDRSHPAMISAYEMLEASGNIEALNDLRIADIPDDAKWFIDDYDGIETVREEHRTW